MSDSNNNIPNKDDEVASEIFDLSNIDTNSIQEEQSPNLDLSQNWLDVTLDFPEPRYMLQYKGVGFSPIGGVQAITGHKKNGKSWLVTMLMAASLGSTKLGNLQLAQGKNIPKEPTVLYIDTEQEIENTMRVARRVHYLMGWEFKKANKRFRVLWLREEDDNQTRWEKVQQAINEVKPNMVFLDGIRDVISDINDPEASSILITKCMKIASTLQLCIWCILHYNPGTDKMRGHLGTELGNKVTDTFQVTKKKEGGVVTFKVNQVDARGKDVEDFEFNIKDTIVKFGIPEILDDLMPVEPSNNDDEKRANLLKPMKIALTTPLKFDDLVKALRDQNFSKHAAEEGIHDALDLNIIKKNSRGKYVYKGDDQQAESIEFPTTEEDGPVPF